MRKTLLHTRISALFALVLSAQAMAETKTLDVTFTATLRETTCDMKIQGGTGNGLNNTIPIGTSGKTSLADITSGSANASTTFKLLITECPASLSGLKTTITGNKSGYIDAIVNAATSTPADYMAVSIARASAPDSPFAINSTDDSKRLVWSADEISNKEVQLIAQLLETQTGKGTTGNFSAIATFNFVYE